MSCTELTMSFPNARILAEWMRRTCEQPADGAGPLDGRPPDGEGDHLAAVQHKEALQQRREAALTRQTSCLRGFGILLIFRNLLHHGSDCKQQALIIQLIPVYCKINLGFASIPCTARKCTTGVTTYAGVDVDTVLQLLWPSHQYLDNAGIAPAKPKRYRCSAHSTATGRSSRTASSARLSSGSMPMTFCAKQQDGSFSHTQRHHTVDFAQPLTASVAAAGLPSFGRAVSSSLS